MSTTLHLVKLSSDFLQSTKLCFVVDVIGAACFHLFLQITIQLTVLCCCLTSLFSGGGFFLCCEGKLCLGLLKQSLINKRLSQKYNRKHVFLNWPILFNQKVNMHAKLCSFELYKALIGQSVSRHSRSDRSSVNRMDGSRF